MCNEHLKNIDQQLKNGVIPPTETVRGFLTWFGASRRGYNVVQTIRSELEKFNLKTEPDFEIAYIDESIQFVRAGENPEANPYMVDPIIRIGRLESANRKPVSVKPDEPLRRATTILMAENFSQLPVMTTEREVKGVVSWQSIGSRLALGDSNDGRVSQFMDDAIVVTIDTSLFDAIKVISEYSYVLVRAVDQTICGIVTAVDLSLQFRSLAEPFLLIGEIERYIRQIIYGKFSVAELQEVHREDDPNRMIEGVAGLTFGEYIRLMENEQRWLKLQLNIDRAGFLRNLNWIREIRNDVMHFDPDGLSDQELETLRSFCSFLRTLRKAGAF